MSGRAPHTEDAPPALPVQLVVSAAIWFLLSAPEPSRAQTQAPGALGDPAVVMQDFEPAGKYALEIDGESIPDARVYVSLEAGSALLLTAPGLPSPLLVKPRERRLDRLPQTDLLPRPDGAVALAPGAELETAGTYTIDGASLLLRVGDDILQLVERPLLGLHGAAKVADWDPEYARRARRYLPSHDTLESLRQTDAEARVRVYFGSWCPRCALAVPRLMRLAAELESSGLDFEFFGMPRLETDAPESFWHEAQKAGIFDDDVEMVPLVAVYRGDQRIGRITDGWDNPEREIEKILVSAASTAGR